MCASFFSPGASPAAPRAVPEAGVQPWRQAASEAKEPCGPQGAPAFLPYGARAFSLARERGVPVFLIIGEADAAFGEPSLATLIAERTVPVLLAPGMRPDVELLCRQAGALFSGEGALPLCALLLPEGVPFLAAPLPPPGFTLDPSRLYVWLSQADRRLSQNPPALLAQAVQVVRAFQPPAPAKPYAPPDAAHDLERALLALEDKVNGGFGGEKTPLVCALLFLERAAARGNRACRAALSRALDAMLASPLYDPLDGLFFRATLTADWRVFVPEKPLALNALLALLLLNTGRRTQALRALDALLASFSAQGGGFFPLLSAPRELYAFTPEQVCAALGAEDGLRACRLLRLLRRHERPDPAVAPSRFCPPAPEPAARREEREDAPLCPRLAAGITPEDEAFLHRALPRLLRARSARAPQRPAPRLITEECAIAAAVFAHCGRRLGEPRYTQAAQRAVARLAGLSPELGGLTPLPPSFSPCAALQAQPTCGAAAALSLALLTLGQDDGAGRYADSGLKLLGSALHAFLARGGLVYHTPDDPADGFPRVPAVMDDELPSPAALLVRSLRVADGLRPQAHYAQTIESVWLAAAPFARAAPLSLASLISASAF